MKKILEKLQRAREEKILFSLCSAEAEKLYGNEIYKKKYNQPL